MHKGSTIITLTSSYCIDPNQNKWTFGHVCNLPHPNHAQGRELFPLFCNLLWQIFPA